MEAPTVEDLLDALRWYNEAERDYNAACVKVADSYSPAYFTERERIELDRRRDSFGEVLTKFIDARVNAALVARGGR